MSQSTVKTHLGKVYAKLGAQPSKCGHGGNQPGLIRPRRGILALQTGTGAVWRTQHPSPHWTSQEQG